MKGMTISECCHIVPVLCPKDINGGVDHTNGIQRFSMENYSHVSIIVSFGVTAAAATALKVYESTSAAGGSRTARAFNYYAQTTTASGDVLGARTAATAAAGVATPGDLNGSTYVIELDASELTDGYPWLEIEITAPGSSILASAVAILTGARYGGVSSPTILS